MTPTLLKTRQKLAEGLYWRGSTIWVKVYESGKPIQQSTKTSDPDLAKRFRDQLRAKAGRGELGAAIGMKAILVNELLDDDLRRMERECKPNTIKWARRAFDNHIRPWFGALTVPMLTTDMLEKYQQQRLDEDKAEKSSINNELALLRSALYTGYRRTPPKVERVIQFPMFPKSQLTVRHGFIEIEEYEKLVELIEPSLKALVVVLYHLGLRKSEALNLKWDQIEFPRTGRIGLLRLHPLETKNGEPRTCPMYGDLEPYLRRQKEIRDALYPAQPYVFFWMQDSYAHGQEGGMKITPGTAIGGEGRHFKATKSWVESVKAIGHPDLVMHDMRRSAVRNMIEIAGMSVKQAMLYSGHKTMSMAERYHMLGKAELASAHAKLQGMFDNHRGAEPTPAPFTGAVADPSKVINFSDLLKRKREKAG